MDTIKRRIISRKQWDNLIEKGMLKRTETERFNIEYTITLRREAESLYTPETVGKIEEKDYQLTSINCTLGMYAAYIKEEPHDVTVDDDYNPYEHGVGYFVPEWMFEDRQDDLVDLYKRYGKYKEE